MNTHQGVLCAHIVCLLLSCLTYVTAQQSQLAKLDSLEQLLPKAAEPSNKVELLNKIAFGYLNIDAEKTAKFAREALELAQKHKMDIQIGHAHNSLGSYYFYISNLEETAKHFEQSIYFYKKVNHQKGIANVTGNLGIVQYYSGNYAKALEYSFEAVAAFEALHDSTGMANEYSGIAAIYMEQGLYDKALHYDSLSMALYQGKGDREGVALVLGNIGNIYAEQGLRNKANAVYKEAIDIYIRLGNAFGATRLLKSIALLQNEERNYKAAYSYLEQALKINQQHKSSMMMSSLISDLGVVYYLSYKKHGRTDSVFHLVPGSKPELLQNAIKYLSQGVTMFQESKNLKELNHYANILANAYESANDPQNALKYYKIRTAAQDSINNVESKKSIEKLTTEREIALKNKQIELDQLAVEKKRNERAYFGIGISLLLVSMLFIYRNYKNQQKANAQLATLNTQINESNHELSNKNAQLTQTMLELEATQGQLIESEKQKENALIRSRISQDIHDDISAGLTKIAWLAESFMVKAAKAETTPDMSTLDKISHYSRETVSKLGEIIWSSNPEKDNLESLLDYIRRYVNNYFEDSNIHCHIDFPQNVPDRLLHPELRRNLFLVTKEALHNARKYSKASDIYLSFTLISDDHYSLVVRDNGIGMSHNEVQGTGNGLHNMSRRMAAIGGAFKIQTAEKEGVELIFEGNLGVDTTI